MTPTIFAYTYIDNKRDQKRDGSDLGKTDRQTDRQTDSLSSKDQMHKPNAFLPECLMIADVSLPLFSSSMKAMEAAIAARQWKKAVHLLELQEDQSFGKYYLKIAQHYASVQDYQVEGSELLRAST